MSLQKINTRTMVLILMIIAAAAVRLLSYKYPYVLSNFTPVGAIALFGGAYFTDKWKAYLVVLLTLFASDIVINHLYTSKWVLWYGGSFWVYLTFAIMVFIGSLIKKANVANVAIASLVSICIHWLIIDMPWLYGTLYPHNLTGYRQSLVAAASIRAQHGFRRYSILRITFWMDLNWQKANSPTLRSKKRTGRLI